MDGSDEVKKAMQRLAYIFNLSFPAVGFLALTYIGLGDSIFAVFDVIGRRLPRSMRSLMRRFYQGLEVLAASVLHTSMFATCYTTDACTEKPLHRRSCMISTSVTVVAYALLLAVDRVMQLLLKIPTSYPGHARGVRARVFNASAVCACWICIAEGETMGVVLLLAATARRALAPVPLVCGIYMTLIKLYTLAHTVWIVHAPDTCHASSRRAPIAVASTIMTL